LRYCEKCLFVGIFQIPPDFVVKDESIDIVAGIFLLI